MENYKMSSFNDLEMSVLRWSEERRIIPNSNAMTQAIKTTEEVAELLKALSKGDKEEARDAYGDILVTMIIGADFLNLGMLECLDHAYSVIKDRTGHLRPDGIFVKDSA
jgi:hypothetical protein